MGGQIVKAIKENLKPDQTNPNLLTISAHGDNSYGNISHFNDKIHFLQVWAENFQCFGTDIDGNLYAWGLNDYYQLGNGTRENYISESNKNLAFENKMSIINQNEGYIKGKLMSRVNPLYGKKIKKISCGDGFTVFLDCDGTLYSCGKNNKGQLGYDIPYEKAEIISGIKCQSHPKFIEYFMENKIKIIDIVCGSDFSFAIDETNQIYSWGSNDHYQLARGINKLSESKPGLAILVTPCESIVKVCCGWMHGCYLTDKGEVYIWGNPYYDYDRTYSDIQDPIKVEMENRCVDISSGFHHIAIITQDENIFSLFTLGANEFGQLGYETDKEISVIPHMVDFKGTSVMDVVCGSFHTMCLLANEKIFGFGSN